MYGPLLPKVVATTSECNLKEMSILSEDKPPEGFILNDHAFNEMMRIAKAAHMRQDFRIYQGTFFGSDNHAHQLQDNVFNTPPLNQNFPSQSSSSSGISVNNNFSDSYINSCVGSSRSVDSNISGASFGGYHSQR